jgi:hypothetical protein
MAVPRNSIQTIVTAKTLSSVAYIGRRFPVKFSFFLIFFKIICGAKPGLPWLVPILMSVFSANAGFS